MPVPDNPDAPPDQPEGGSLPTSDGTLTIQIQQSTSGIGDSCFTDLATLADNGGGFAFDFSPTISGRLYIIRARRCDSSQFGSCQFSDWTYAYMRGAWPKQEFFDMGAENVAIGALSGLWIGLEAVQGYPVQAQFVLPYTKGGLKRTSGRVYRKALGKRRTMRRGVRPGKQAYKGQFEVEWTPEQGVPCFLQAAFPVTTTNLAGPTRYTHRYPNQFGSKTVTLIQQKGNDYYVYPGCRITSIAVTVNDEGNETLTATIDVVALDELVYNSILVANVPSTLGVTSATEDTLDGFTPVDCLATIGGASAPIKSVTFNVNLNPGERNILNGKRGTAGTFDRMADTTGQANLYYENDNQVIRDMATVLGSGTFAAGDTIALAPFRADFIPPLNTGGFSNELSFVWPNADITSSEDVDGPDEIPEVLTVAPVDPVGNAAATDFYIEITDSVPHATLIEPGVQISPAALPASANQFYDIASVTGAPSTTVFKALAGSQLNASTDGFYIGRSVMFLTGALVGTEQVITAYASATQQITVGTAFGSAPAVGDIFVILSS